MVFGYEIYRGLLSLYISCHLGEKKGGIGRNGSNYAN